jgi:TonB family protein
MKHSVLVTALCMLALSPLLHAQTLASGKPPVYPLAAKAAGIDGPVVLKATISKDGKVQNISIFTGRPELCQAAIDAVQGWTYHPYTQHGHPVEIDITITVDFFMGTGKEKAKAQAKAQALLAQSAQPAQDNTQPPASKQENQQSQPQQ